MSRDVAETAAIVRIESHNRWDAMALAESLTRFRWFLVEPDRDRWDVCVSVETADADLPDDLLEEVEVWLRRRHLSETTAHLGRRDYTIVGSDYGWPR